MLPTYKERQKRRAICMKILGTAKLADSDSEMESSSSSESGSDDDASSGSGSADSSNESDESDESRCMRRYLMWKTLDGDMESYEASKSEKKGTEQQETEAQRLERLRSEKINEFVERTGQQPLSFRAMYMNHMRPRVEGEKRPALPEHQVEHVLSITFEGLTAKEKTAWNHLINCTNLSTCKPREYLTQARWIRS